MARFARFCLWSCGGTSWYVSFLRSTASLNSPEILLSSTRCFVWMPCFASLSISVSNALVVSPDDLPRSGSTKMPPLSTSQRTIMYLLPREDELGNLQVWSVNTFMASSSFVSNTFTMMSFCFDLNYGVMTSPANASSSFFC